jgi:hypothetical protein
MKSPEAKWWDTHTVAERVQLMRRLGWSGRIGSKAWGDLPGEVQRAVGRTVGTMRRRTTVVHRASAPTGAVYIGRGSPWGNPYHIGKDGTREEVIAKYQQWVNRRDAVWREKVRAALRGRVLACYCAGKDQMLTAEYPDPFICHGQILAGIADGEE